MLCVTGYGVEVVAAEIIAEFAQATLKTLPMMMVVLAMAVKMVFMAFLLVG